MWNREQNINNIKREIGWIYHELKWLTEEEAKYKNQERDRILKSISNKVNYAFKQNKIYLGNLSFGCSICGEGAWSCMFLNGLCTGDCFFCPQDRKMGKERIPTTLNGITFDEPDTYIDFLEKFGFRGVGFSGGEPLLVFEKLLAYITKIRKKFGEKIYLWTYTNGDLVNAQKLKRLKRAGLDEIRVNISARNYDLEPVKLAAKFINIVTVEIPVIPEDYEILKKCIFEMQESGVNHLNIHQLVATEHNYRNFINRNYTFLHLPNIPLLESEIIALKLIRYAVDNNIRLPINYCTACYKWLFQGWGHRKRAASLMQERAFEEITDSGYIRLLSVNGSPANIKNIVRVLKENRCQEGLWSLNDTKTEIFFHHFLLKYINFKKHNLSIRYFEPQLIENINARGDYKEIKLNSQKKIFIEKKEVARFEKLSSTGSKSFRKLFIEKMDEKDAFKYFYENYNLKTKEGIDNMMKEVEILMGLKTLEHTREGFPDIY